MRHLIDECAEILNCHPKSLRDHLNHPAKRALLHSKLKGRIVRTLYSDRNDFRKTFTFHGFTHKGAHTLMAYGALSRPYNVSVTAHYYSRHRIRLRYPYLQCVVEKFPRRCEDRYYPLELLELVDDKEEDYIGFPIVNNDKPLYVDVSDKLRIDKANSDSDKNDEPLEFDMLDEMEGW
ncbi:unnamed protein product [Meloidogyne enterolobii]|uniref:Uncharacterized protein n=1 Tax=Meloidogyne enterolobii TaxID=390850 RepID=A0ACB0YV05_MELEN